jgi:hypothetical protein
LCAFLHTVGASGSAPGVRRFFLFQASGRRFNRYFGGIRAGGGLGDMRIMAAAGLTPSPHKKTKKTPIFEKWA